MSTILQPTVAPRDTADVSVSVRDESTQAALHRKTISIQSVYCGRDGAPLCPSGPVYPVEITASRAGSYWSDQPHGRSGRYIIYTVRLPESLRAVKSFAAA